jgi:hypothetical protein
VRAAAAGRVGVLALAMGLSGCAGGTDLSAVAGACTKAVDRAIASAGDEYTGADFLELGDDGESLSVSSPVSGEMGTAITGVAVGCIMRETDAPSTVEAQLRRTTELDGRQEVTWGDLTMSYRFLPNKGLSAVVRQD